MSQISNKLLGFIDTSAAFLKQSIVDMDSLASKVDKESIKQKVAMAASKAKAFADKFSADNFKISIDYDEEKGENLEYSIVDDTLTTTVSFTSDKETYNNKSTFKLPMTPILQDMRLNIDKVRKKAVFIFLPTQTENKENDAKPFTFVRKEKVE